MTERIDEMRQMRGQGATYAEIAAHFGLSRQRIHALLRVRGARGYSLRSAYARFWRRVRMGDDCWTRDGAAFYLNGKTETPYRAAWILQNGPVPGGYKVVHVCGNPDCVRPDHLRTAPIKQGQPVIEGGGRV